MGKLFEGRVAIITGSGQGIGKELALYMASEGCKIVTNNRKKGSSMQAHDGKTVKLSPEDEAVIRPLVGDAETTAAAIIAAGGEAVPVYGSSSNAEDCKRMVDAAIEKWGRIDIVINNAASHWNGNIKDADIEKWHLSIDSKLNGTFYLLHYALPYMLKQKYGKFVNFSSNAFVGLAGMASYSSAACGLWAFTKSAAQDLAADGIAVNCVTPLAATRSWYNTVAEFRAEGIPIDVITQQAPAGMQMTPDNMVPAIAYLAAEECKVTGQMVKVEADGSLALYADAAEYNNCGKDCAKDGPWTVDELREVFRDHLLKNAKTATTSLTITKSEY